MSQMMDRIKYVTPASILLLIVIATIPHITAANQNRRRRINNNDNCKIFMGPSQVKEVEQQGFGMGMFTGIDIYPGQDIDLNEVLLPLADSATIDMNHPPLREYLWPGATLPEVAFVSSSNRNALWFSPGLASIAPCTSDNFNLAITGSGGWAGQSRHNLVEDDVIPPRTSPLAGSYSYHHSISYTAQRHISPGEELVLQCNEDGFDKTITTSNFNSSDPSFVCIDNVKSGPSKAIGGMGLFAQRHISKGGSIISSPLVPIHRKELFGDGSGVFKAEPGGSNTHQLMLNYAFGHEDSDLLLLPHGPLVSYINHPPPGKKANAIIKWHSKEKSVSSSSRRQQYHHPELFDLSANVVSETHGKGLMIDIVALNNDIEIDEEIYIDYGGDWLKAWENHKERWKAPSGASSYISADKWFHLYDGGRVRTIDDLQDDPYPNNIETICYFDNDADLLRVDEENHTVYTSWEDDELPHECLRPCNILERYPDPGDDDDDDDNDDDDDDDDNGDKELLYTAEMFNFEGASEAHTSPFCLLPPGRHISRDIGYDGIMILDKPYSSDMFLEQAFRHAIGVPKDFFPNMWLRQKLRRKSAGALSVTGSEFKRKKVGEVISAKMLLKKERASSARMDL